MDARARIKFNLINKSHLLMRMEMEQLHYFGGCKCNINTRFGINELNNG